MAKDSSSKDETDRTTANGEGFPIVGIGASAGGLAAFEAFFSAMPTDGDLGMAFVVVQHLAPDHVSVLSDLVRRYTPMSVVDVENGMPVEPDCAYIIPPNRDMTIAGGALYLCEPTVPRGQRLPIDLFFRSLAADQKERSIAIVLSGTGSDGAHGIRAIKGQGGMVMAQEPESTEFDGMPKSAIATGLVDYTLLPSDMPARLIAYANHAFGPSSDGSKARVLRPGEVSAEIFSLLLERTGHDFSQYKPNTIRRRIERRMSVRQVDTIDAYAKVLREAPAEAQTLARELMIGVTSFFRDRACFSALAESILTEIVSHKSNGDTIRVWSAGCSTGEEAYSIAIAVREALEKANKTCRIQVFGTDIDSHAIAIARAGSYPVGIAADLSPERLERFFIPADDGSSYEVTKAIREMLVFSEQDIVKDPPFSRLDLVSCRNVLIYMGSELQRKIIPIFHYALLTGGMLFLGNSETIGQFGDLFATRDRAAKLFVRKEGAGRLIPSSEPAGTAKRAKKAITSPYSESQSGSLETRLRRSTEQALLDLVAPTAVLVTSDGVIRYVHGRTGLYLETAPGVAGANNVLKMAREGLRHRLIVALHKAQVDNAKVVSRGLWVTANDKTVGVDVTVSPVPPLDESLDAPALFVVLFEQTQSTSKELDDHETAVETATAHDQGIVLLQKELHEKDEYLRTTVEELETSNEELRSANEEMQSINEELQSTNEELETSKEELQSTNEELSTVNSELQVSVGDLSRANNDMNNLLSGTGVGTVFIDHQLRILRFTPSVTEIINLIPGDIGRPVGHIVSNLVGYDELVQDVQSVLESLVPKEVEVQTIDEQWYTLRIVPYRTTDNVIEGAVVTFFNISEMIEAREKIAGLLHQKNILLREVHHRVKNNMNTVVALLSVQSSTLDSEVAIEALSDAQHRIRTMALLYDRFYRAEQLESVPLSEYIEPLIEECVDNFPPGIKVDVEVAIEDITLEAETLFPLGILVNELLSNIVKYAFVGRTRGKIMVSASNVDGRVVLSIADDGVGIPDSIDISHANGFGLTLISELATQLGGEVRIERGVGSRVVLEFSA